MYDVPQHIVVPYYLDGPLLMVQSLLLPDCCDKQSHSEV
jgi:hypothetical protein